MVWKQSHQKELIWTPPSHDKNFFKHVTNMKATGVNNKTEHGGLILISESLRIISPLHHLLQYDLFDHRYIVESFTSKNMDRAIHHH